MGIHLMAPLFEMVIKAGKEQLILEWDPPFYQAFGIFSNLWYGNVFLPPYNFKLTKIEVRYFECTTSCCTVGKLHVYDTPVAGGVLPALIASQTISMPSLPYWQPGIWVPFEFNQPPLIKDHLYLLFSEGCSIYYTTPFHCTYAAYHGGTGIPLCMWTYDKILGYWVLAQNRNRSLSYKVWGVPT
jgi:hypothetical protein